MIHFLLFLLNSLFSKSTFSKFFSSNTPDVGDSKKVKETEWVRKEFDLAQADVRALATANEGWGYKLFTAAGVNRIIQISNPVFYFKRTGGDDFNIASENEILSRSDSGAVIFSSVSSYNVSDVPVLNYNAGQVLVAGNAGGNYEINKDIYLYDGNIPANYEGTAKLILDYRILNLEN